MRFYFGNSLENEIESILKRLNKQQDNKQLKDDLNVLGEKVTELSSKVASIEKALNSLLAQKQATSTTVSSSKVNSQPHVRQMQQVQPKKQHDAAPQPKPTANATQIVYSAFEGHGFPIKFKVGLGSEGLANARGNWVVEAVKGSETGIFYPNAAVMKSLAFNPEYNLAPVCDITISGNMALVAPGKVRLDTASNTFVIIQNCKISL